MTFYRDPIREMARAARRLLPKSPGIIFPGWFWQEWMLLFGAIVIVGAIIYLCVLIGG